MTDTERITAQAELEAASDELLHCIGGVNLARAVELAQRIGALRRSLRDNGKMFEHFERVMAEKRVKP